MIVSASSGVPVNLSGLFSIAWIIVRLEERICVLVSARALSNWARLTAVPRSAAPISAASVFGSRPAKTPSGIPAAAAMRARSSSAAGEASRAGAAGAAATGLNVPSSSAAVARSAAEATARRSGGLVGSGGLGEGGSGRHRRQVQPVVVAGRIGEGCRSR